MGAPPPQEQRGRGRRLQDSRHLAATSKSEFGAVLNLHVVASPGPSGERTSGAEVLRRWCNAIAAGKMTSWVSRLWAAAMVRLFVKSDGQGIRPVACGEALFEFAMTVCVAPLQGYRR